jgi:DNA-binding NarL/FixJ family response regulator
VTIAPSDGILRDRNGNVSIGYGAIVSYYFPQSDEIHPWPRSCSQTRIIVATADIQSSTHEMAEQVGSLGFVTKPIRSEELLRVVTLSSRGGPVRPSEKSFGQAAA